jgi:hypothetical protein
MRRLAVGLLVLATMGAASTLIAQQITPASATCMSRPPMLKRSPRYPRLMARLAPIWSSTARCVCSRSDATPKRSARSNVS